MPTDGEREKAKCRRLRKGETVRINGALVTFYHDSKGRPSIRVKGRLQAKRKNGIDNRSDEGKNLRS